MNSVGFVSRTALYTAHIIRNAAVTVPLSSFKPSMGSIMTICFCCKSILPVYLSCPSSTLSNIGLFPPPRSASFWTTTKAGSTRPLFFCFFSKRNEKKHKKHQRSLASAPPCMMKWSRRCSDLPKFRHPRVYCSPFLVIQDDARIPPPPVATSTHFPPQLYDKAGSMLLKIVTLLRKLESQQLFIYLFFMVWRHPFLLLVAWK